MASKGAFVKNGHSDFSALEYSKELRGVGFTQDQAELQARQLELMKSEIESVLATKQDVELLIKNTEKEIIKYVGNQNLKIVTILGALIAIFKFLPDFFN